MTRLAVLAYAVLMLALFALVGGAWVEGLRRVLKARRLGEVRTGFSVGKAIFRSRDPLAFRRSLRWRSLWLAVLLPGVLWLGLLTLLAFGALVVTWSSV